MIDKTLAHYQIRDKLGSGGMGDVYRAHDSKLGRDVALKVLPEEMAGDEERRMRFQREAKVVAALKHPNIVTIHSVEEDGGVNFLTMELVEGQTLADLIPSGGMSLDRFFDVAIPLADALASAHAHGITHRDLKPANVMRDTDGRIKVLDFGLAKLLDPDDGMETLKTLVDQSDTQEGRVMGTAAYMSPEQAEGKPIDHRSDVFSMGVILFEMITGNRPFEGETTMSTLSAIIREPAPSITEIKQTIPRHLGRIIKRCLEKDPSRRIQTALDLRNELENLKAEIDSGELEADAPAAAGPSPARRTNWWPIVAAIVIVASYLVYSGFFAPSAPTSGTARSKLSFVPITERGGIEEAPSISPDGNYVVYHAGPAGNRDIFLHRIGGTKSINLTEGSDTDDGYPAYSPNGDRIAFRSARGGGGIFVMGATGESVKRLTDFGFRPAWSPDGKKIVFETEPWQSPLGRSGISQLVVLDVASGQTTAITGGDITGTDEDAVDPDWSPNGHRIAYWNVLDATGGQRDISTITPDGHNKVAVTQDPAVDWSPVWGDNGEYLYFVSDRGGTMNIWRVPIDERSGQVRGDFEPVPAPTAQAGAIDVSADGRHIAFANISARSNIYRVSFDPQTETVGAAEAITSGSLPVTVADVSPDGRWVTFRSLAPKEDIYIIRSDGSDMRKLTDDPHRDRGPKWSPDGSHIVFYSDRTGRYEFTTIDPDGSDLTTLTTTAGQSLWFPFYSPDGTKVAGGNAIGSRIIDLKTIPADVAASFELPPVDDQGSTFRAVAWSPDGRRIAGGSYGTDHRGQPFVHVYSLDSGAYESFELDRRGFLWMQWLGDNRRVVVSVGDALQILDTETGRWTDLWTDMGGFGASLPDDESAIYFTSQSTETDIWMATME